MTFLGSTARRAWSICT